MKLLPLQDVTEPDLLFVCTPFYAWCIVDDAHSGFVRIKGYDEHFENCKRQACQLAGDPSHWNDLLLGRERMDGYVKRGSLALVMESGDFPLHPMHQAFVEENGQPKARENLLEPDIRQHLQYHVDRLHHERLERGRYAANHPQAREPEYLPAGGPGHRPATLGPHAGPDGKSGSGERVFWSGRQGANRAAAEDYAKKTGGTTLEMTPAGQALEAQGAGIDAWRIASAEFAKGASGQVTAFAGGARPDSVWQTIEKPLLLQNKNVTSIVIKDSFNTAKTTTIFPRR